MSNMFKRAAPSRQRIQVTVDGEEVTVEAGDTVAAALFTLGKDACRTTPVTGSLRGPFCMMGVCFDCLVRIDSKANQQGCMVTVSPGMRIEHQHGARVIMDVSSETAEVGSGGGDR
jgi:predicted molibdopterin-dependent oxidoreductase YjgC